MHEQKNDQGDISCIFRWIGNCPEMPHISFLQNVNHLSLLIALMIKQKKTGMNLPVFL